MRYYRTPGSSAGLISASGFACFIISFREVCISCSSSSPADVSFEEYDLPSTPSPCRRLSRPQSTMGRSEFPVPCSTSTLRLTVPTCFAGGQGHSQVLVRFSSSMPHSLTPVESTRTHHIALFMLASVTLTTSPSTFVHLTGLNRLRKCGLPYGLLDSLSTLRPESHQTVRKTRYWWVVSPYQIETFILSEPPSFAWRTNVVA